MEAPCQLKEDFKWFRSECMKLRNTFNTYSYLYEADDETTRVIRESAKLFFNDLNDWLIHMIIQQICRITDPAKMNGKQNLTVAYIVCQLQSKNLCTSEIKKLAKDIENYRKLIVGARNKVIGHADLKTFRQVQKHGEHSKEECDEFFANLNQFTDEVGKVLGCGPLDYSVQAGEGDVQDLIRLMRNYRKIKQIVR